MTTIRAHFDGKVIVLDEPMPTGIPPNMPVTVVVQNGNVNGAGEAPNLLDRLKQVRVDGTDLPPDFAEQHEHYTSIDRGHG